MVTRRARPVVGGTLAALVAIACNALTGASDLEVGEPSCGDACGADAATTADGSGEDAAVPSDGAPPPADAATDGGAIPDADAGPAFCDQTDPTLLLCMPFEGTASDVSQTATASSATAVTYESARVGMGAVFGGASSVYLPDTELFSATAVTVEMFVKLTSLPVSGRRVLFDIDGRMAVYVNAAGSVVCLSTPASATVAVPLGQYVHVACSIGPTAMVLYKDGAASVTAAATLAAGTGQPVGIGANVPSGEGLVGTLDELRVWSTERTPAQILAAAQRGK